MDADNGTDCQIRQGSWEAKRLCVARQASGEPQLYIPHAGPPPAPLLRVAHRRRTPGGYAC
jgi:hypothetical protein